MPTKEKKIHVKYSIKEEVLYRGTVEMTRKEYREWCLRIDSSRGSWARQTTAENFKADMKIGPNDGFLASSEIDDFDEVA